MKDVPPKSWTPITFFDPPSNITNTATPAIEAEADITPSFCDATLPQGMSGSGTPPAVILPACSPTPIPARHPGPFYSRPGSQPSTRASSPRQQAPRPYNVAMDLMARLSLRMVDNALYAFDGQVYRFVSAPVMNRLIMAHCRQYVQAVGDASLIERIYKIIQAEPSITYRPPRQALPLVAMEDGLVNLDTLTLHPFSPDYFVTARLNGNFAKGGTTTCPLFDQFLQQVSGGDKTLIERIWQVIGYSIVPDTSAKCFILFQGVPDSGKSLLGSIIEALLDEDLVTSLDFFAMGERFGPSELVGKLLCLALDLPSGAFDPKSVSLVKTYSGGDTVTVDVKYQARIKFRCTATFVLATNHPFLTRDNDPAFFQRAVVVPFRYAIPQAQQDRTLRERILAAERDAIIFKALQAYQRLRQANYQFAGNFQVNEIFSTNTGPAVDLMGILWNFGQAHCIPSPDGFAPTAQVYALFQQVTGLSWPGGINKFSAEIATIFDQLYPGAIQKDRRRTGGGKNPERGFIGLNLSL